MEKDTTIIEHISESVELFNERVKPEILHGVHLACQMGNEFYVTECGIAVDPSEQRFDSDQPECVTCFESYRCHLCDAIIV